MGCNFQEEEVVLMADARAEEAVRKAEAKLKKKREQEVKDAERDAAEMAHLMANDPEVRHVFSALYTRVPERERVCERERGRRGKTDQAVRNFDDERLASYSTSGPP